MTVQHLSTLLATLAERHPVPGACLATWQDGRVEAACHGVTSVENPLPIDRGTRFQVGSITKTFTATAVLRLVHQGLVALDDPVRAHVPGLRLADERVAGTVTVAQLLNHTSGWDGTLTSGGDDPDRPLSAFVEGVEGVEGAEGMAGLEQLTSPGSRAAYNSAGVALAGRLVEIVTGEPYERALRTLLLDPLGLSHTGFTTDDLVTERVAVGHTTGDGGRFAVARPWRWPSAAGPEGGLVSTLDDQLAWAAFHLGDGTAPDGTRLLDEPELASMRTATIELVGNALGEAVGLGWFLRDVGGALTAGHPGSTNGQLSELCLVPDRRFAVIVAANGTPGGMALTRDAVDTVLADRLGLRREEPVPRAYDPATDGDVTGTFESGVFALTVTADDGEVRVHATLQPAVAAQMGGEVPVFAPSTVGFLPGDRGEYVLRDGPFAGQKGSFGRAAGGTVTEIDFGGRWHRRT